MSNRAQPSAPAFPCCPPPQHSSLLHLQPLPLAMPLVYLLVGNPGTRFGQ